MRTLSWDFTSEVAGEGLLDLLRPSPVEMCGTSLGQRCPSLSLELELVLVLVWPLEFSSILFCFKELFPAVP